MVQITSANWYWSGLQKHWFWVMVWYIVCAIDVMLWFQWVKRTVPPERMPAVNNQVFIWRVISTCSLIYIAFSPNTVKHVKAVISTECRTDSDSAYPKWTSNHTFNRLLAKHVKICFVFFSFFSFCPPGCLTLFNGRANPTTSKSPSNYYLGIYVSCQTSAGKPSNYRPKLAITLGCKQRIELWEVAKPKSKAGCLYFQKLYVDHWNAHSDALTCCHL